MQDFWWDDLNFFMFVFKQKNKKNTSNYCCQKCKKYWAIQLSTSVLITDKRTDAWSRDFII